MRCESALQIDQCNTTLSYRFSPFLPYLDSPNPIKLSIALGNRRSVPPVICSPPFPRFVELSFAQMINQGINGVAVSHLNFIGMGNVYG